MTRTTATVFVILLAGCAAQPPTNPSNPNADFYGDRWDCQKQVAAMPQARAAQAPQVKTDTVTHCVPSGTFDGGVVCRSSQQPSSGGGTGPVEAMFQTQALIAAQRSADAPREALVSCMRSKGWR